MIIDGWNKRLGFSEAIAESLPCLADACRGEEQTNEDFWMLTCVLEDFWRSRPHYTGPGRVPSHPKISSRVR